MQRTRRQLLELGGATLATVSLAGCVGGELGTDTDDPDGGTPTDGDGESTPTATATDTATPTPTETPTPADTPTPAPTGDRSATDLAGYAEWLPAPSTIEFVDDAGYAFLGLAPAQLVELADSLGDGATDALTQETPLPGIDTLADATVFLRFARSTFLYETDFDRETTKSELAELGFSGAGTHRGFTVFTAGSGDSGGNTRAAAVSDDAIVLVGQFSSNDSLDKRPAIEAIVDARTGNAERYTDAVPECGRLVEALGNSHAVTGRTHETGATFEGAVGEGTSTHVASEHSRVRASVVFDGEADGDPLAEWAGDAELFHGQEPTTRADESVATADALVPTGEITAFSSEFPGPPISDDSGPRTPQVNFAFEYEETGDGQGLLEISHDGGDTVPAEELFVRGSGFADVSDADQTAAGQWQGTASGDDNAVVAGDFVEVGVTADYDISVVWESSDGDPSATLAQDQGPDA